MVILNEQWLSWEDSREYDSLYPGHAGVGLAPATQARWVSISHTKNMKFTRWSVLCLAAILLAFAEVFYDWQSGVKFVTLAHPFVLIENEGQHSTSFKSFTTNNIQASFN